MITVYHLLNSRSERVIWLLEELGESYEIQAFAREPTGAAPAAYRALHPVGASPIVRDGAVLACAIITVFPAIVTWLPDVLLARAKG